MQKSGHQNKDQVQLCRELMPIAFHSPSTHGLGFGHLVLSEHWHSLIFLRVACSKTVCHLQDLLLCPSSLKKRCWTDCAGPYFTSNILKKGLSMWYEECQGKQGDNWKFPCHSSISVRVPPVQGYVSLPEEQKERTESVLLHKGNRRKEEGRNWFSSFKMTECQQ